MRWFEIHALEQVLPDREPVHRVLVRPGLTPDQASLLLRGMGWEIRSVHELRGWKLLRHRSQHILGGWLSLPLLALLVALPIAASSVVHPAIGAILAVLALGVWIHLGPAPMPGLLNGMWCIFGAFLLFWLLVGAVLTALAIEIPRDRAYLIACGILAGLFGLLMIGLELPGVFSRDSNMTGFDKAESVLQVLLLGGTALALSARLVSPSVPGPLWVYILVAVLGAPVLVVCEAWLWRWDPRRRGGTDPE